MDNRSPIIFIAVLVGGLLLAGVGGFVVARQMGAPAAVPVAAADAPMLDTALAMHAPDGLVPAEGTDAEIEPMEEVVAAAAPAAQPAAPVARRASAPARTAPPAAPAVRPAAAAAVPDRQAPSRSAPARSAPAPSPAPARTTSPETPPAGADETPAEGSGVYSRPFPAPDAAASLPSRMAPRIDAPPPPPRTRTVTLPSDSVVGLQLESTVTSATAKVEDTVRARVTRDVFADGVMIIPAGSRVTGSVTLVDEGGKVRERARLGVRFHTLVLADGTQLRLGTETIYRDGESPSGRSTARIGGGAAAGAVIGAILGGGKGAAVGAAVGAGGGTAATMAGGRTPATLPAGQTVTVRLSSPISVEVEEP
jgi:hypothetical protein